MGKHVDFGKDLNVMAEVVRRGLSIGIGHYQLWDALSKPGSGLWQAVLQYYAEATPQHIVDSVSWKTAARQHCCAPDLDTLDAVVREGRQHGFGKVEWQRLVESASFFMALFDYLKVAPPFHVDVVVDYRLVPVLAPVPLVVKEELLKLVDPVARSLPMAIYEVEHERIACSDIGRMFGTLGHRFANFRELAAFGRWTTQSVRPWAMFGNRSVMAPGSMPYSPTHEQDWINIPEINGNHPTVVSLTGRFLQDRLYFKCGDLLLVIKDDTIAA